MITISKTHFHISAIVCC